MNRLKLKPGKEKKIRNQYLWIFRDDFATHPADQHAIEDGSLVEVIDSEGHFLAVGYYNGKSHIPVRVLSRQNVKIDQAFYHRRLERAIEFRNGLHIHSNSRRLVHAEADLMPGLMVDDLDGHLVVQFRTLGMETHRADILQSLEKLLSPKSIFDRSDMESRLEEGLEQVSGILSGEVPPRVVVTEEDLKFNADILTGHKTGFYLDQRDNRKLIRSLVKPNQRGLDLFSYSGGFAMAMALSGVTVRAVDEDPGAISLMNENAALNGVEKKIEGLCGDVFDFLETESAEVKTRPQQVRKYDAIIIDPPALAKRKDGMDKLKWAYWKLLVQSLSLLNSGGYIVLSSCAYHMSLDLMHEAARFASADLGLRLRVVMTTFQPPDHPHILQIPETLYLKTIFFQRLN